MTNWGDKANFIWSVADLIRGPYRPNQYKDVMLPMTVLRRLDCALEPTKDAVLARLRSLEQGAKLKNVEPVLCHLTGMPFCNTSLFNFEKLKGLSALRPLEAEGTFKNRDKFSAAVKRRLDKAGLKVPAPLFKAILTTLSEQDETADVCTDAKGNAEPDPELRDYENVPLKEDVAEYIKREVLPHVPDAWIDESKTKIGYEINFNRYFYKYVPPRPLDEIEADLRQIEREIADLLAEVTE